MTYVKSLTMVVTIADRDNANKLMRGLGRDVSPNPGNTFSVELNLDGDNQRAVSHYAAHGWDDALVDILTTLTLPGGIDWSRVGLTQVEAQNALNSIRFSAIENRTPLMNFNIAVAIEGVERVRRSVG